MAKSKKRFHAQDYSSGLMNRERMEASDYSMISEDHSSIANLPQQAIYKPWPKVNYHGDFEMEDNIRGIDRQIDSDSAGMRKHRSTKKY